MTTCARAVRGGGACQLDPEHRGCHSTVVYVCDGCGKRRRGQPHVYGRDGEYEHGIALCFLCSGDTDADQRRAIRLGWEG